jgi:hypothetical protein
MLVIVYPMQADEDKQPHNERLGTLRRQKWTYAES